MNGSSLRAGIVGYGYMGEIRRRVIDDHRDLTLVGIADPRLAGSDDLGVPVVAKHEALFSLGCDVIFSCTPNNVTADVVVDALSAGAHVFAEKPPGRNVEDVERIIAAERAHPDRKVMFGFNHRYHPSVTDAKAVIDSGRLGRLLWLRGVYGKSGDDDFPRSWRNDPTVSGGGILLDQGIHMLDLFCLFCGDFEEVIGMTATSFWDVPVEDNAFVLLRNRRGQLAQLHSSATLWRPMFRLEIGLGSGYMAVNGLLSRSGRYGTETLLVGRRGGAGEPREETTIYDTDPSWHVQVASFVEAIRTGAPLTDSTTEDALRVMRIVERVYEGSRPQQRVRP